MRPFCLVHDNISGEFDHFDQSDPNAVFIADAAEVLLSDYGNPGMASGGMGDVLSGVIGALLAQQLPPLEAAALGVCLHGAAADMAAEEGMCGLLATDLMPHLRQLLGN